MLPRPISGIWRIPAKRGPKFRGILLAPQIGSPQVTKKEGEYAN